MLYFAIKVVFFARVESCFFVRHLFLSVLHVPCKLHIVFTAFTVLLLCRCNLGIARRFNAVEVFYGAIHVAWFRL